MNDYFSRSELPPVDRTAVRATAPVQAVQPVSASSDTAASSREARRDERAEAASVDVAHLDGEAASAAEYAEVHARIADILADLHSQTGTMDVAEAAAAVQVMMPVPIVLVPMPPASREAVEQAAVLARRIVEQASYAHAAHAAIPRGAVEQVVASAA